MKKIINKYYTDMIEWYIFLEPHATDLILILT